MYPKILKDNSVVQSISRKGNCLNNSMMENFFEQMKNELLYVNDFESIECFQAELKKYILWYNAKRGNVDKKNKTGIKRNEPGTIPSSLL